MTRRRLVRWILVAVIAWPLYSFLLAGLAAWWSGLLMAETVREFVEALKVWERWDYIGTQEFRTHFMLPSLGLSLAQIVFLAPVCSRRPKVGERGRALTMSLIIGAGIAGVLTMGVVLGLTEIVGLFTGFDWSDLGGEVIALLVAGCWLFWSGLLLVFCTDRNPRTLLSRLVARLFAGTLIEVLAVLPIDIMVRRRTSCYCFTGSYVALCIAGAVALWLAGPGAFLLLWSKRRRTWDELHCPACGYEKGPRPGPACPECGTAWGRAAAASGGDPTSAQGD